MPLGLLSSSLVGQVSSGKVLGILPSGLVGEVDRGSAAALDILASGLVGESYDIPVYIGYSSGTGATSNGSTTTSIQLPSGCRAGDIALFVVNTSDANASSFTVTAPSVTTVISPYNYSSASSQYKLFGVYIYTLTSADVAAGSVTVVTSAMAVSGTGLALYRSDKALETDTVGSVAKGTAPANAITNMTAPGINVAANALCLCIVASTLGGVPLVFDAPAGFKTDLDAHFDPSEPTAIYHRPPEVVGGASGDVTAVQDRTNFGNPGDWAIVLASLRQAVPGVAITFSLPAATVDAAYSGSITAANTNGATGAITISATGLPAGLSLGATVDNGDGTYTADVTGTPTTSGSFTVSATATNGTQSETLQHTITVSAMTLIGTLPDTTTGAAYSGSLTLGGSFVAPVTISGLPSWMTASVSGTTVTVSGTAPSSTETDNFTPVATDANGQTADGPAQSVAVTASSSTGPKLIQQAGSYYTNNSPFVFPATPKSGNTILLTVLCNSSAPPATPSGYTLAASYAIPGAVESVYYFTKVSDGTETQVTVTWSGTHTYNTLAFQEWQGAITLGTFTGGRIAPPTSPQTLGPSDAPPSASAVPNVFMVFNNAPNAGSMAGWNLSLYTATGAVYGAAGVATEAAPDAAVSPSITFTPNSAGEKWLVWSNVWIT